jgi:hypothetical protein
MMPMDSSDIGTVKAGEVKSLAFRLPAGISPGDITKIDVSLQAQCGCGGQMRRAGTKWEWRCERDHWWKFWDRNHAHLVMERSQMGTVKQP